jgi:hypothetical protein
MKRFSTLVFSAALAICAAMPVSAASLAYDSWLDFVFAGTVVKTDTYKCALTTSAYTESRGTHQYFSDVTNEVTGTGYTAGGVTVVPTFVKDTTNHRIQITFPQFALSNSTITGRKSVCYKWTGTASTSPLVFVNDFGSDVSTTNGTFTVNASTITITTP